ncbi:MAG TPA: hypothetical protein VFV99_14345 [Kofleriaceae bacterium]|nr:hypothetical protein [Kofleriaceae bacterium]
MRRSAVVVALVVMASACGKNESSPAASGSAAGSAAANDPWSKPAAPAPAPAAAPCDDADIKKHIDDSLAVSLAYMAALEKKALKWKTDCSVAKKDLLALEPEATKFMASVNDFMTWGKTLTPECGKRVAEIGEQYDAARDIEKRTPELEAHVKTILEHCKDYPGFQDAAAKGLRVMHKKKP